MYLQENKRLLNIHRIKRQPHFLLLNEFNVPCNRCRGEGKKPSPKTGNPIKCKRCDGTGKVTKQSWNYTGDFEIEYLDGYKEIVDVKGHASESFRLYRKLFEHTTGMELVVVKKSKKGWVRK